MSVLKLTFTIEVDVEPYLMYASALMMWLRKWMIVSTES